MQHFDKYWRADTKLYREVQKTSWSDGSWITEGRVHWATYDELSAADAAFGTKIENL